MWLGDAGDCGVRAVMAKRWYGSCLSGSEKDGPGDYGTAEANGLTT